MKNHPIELGLCIGNGATHVVAGGDVGLLAGGFKY